MASNSDYSNLSMTYPSNNVNFSVPVFASTFKLGSFKLSNEGNNAMYTNLLGSGYMRAQAMQMGDVPLVAITVDRPQDMSRIKIPTSRGKSLMLRGYGSECVANSDTPQQAYNCCTSQCPLNYSGEQPGRQSKQAQDTCKADCAFEVGYWLDENGNWKYPENRARYKSRRKLNR